MAESSYLYLYLIAFIIIIGIIAALIYSDVQNINKTDQLNDCGKSILNLVDLFNSTLRNPVPLTAFINSYAKDYKGQILPILSYDPSGINGLTINSSNNIISSAIKYIDDSVFPMDKNMEWRLTITNNTTIKISNNAKTLFWAIPTNPSSGNPITLTASGTSFTLNNGYLTTSDYILGLVNNTVVIIDKTSNISIDTPIIIYEIGYSPNYTISCGGTFISRNTT